MKTPTTEHPILFSTPMVQAILERRKTMTRRISKHQHWSFSELIDVNENGITQKNDRTVSCPYGQPGDKLWVRETWAKYRAFGESVLADAPFIYKADQDECDQYPCLIDGEVICVSNRGGWKPSIHMPKAAARIWLEIVSVKVERLQDITVEDAIKEGIKKEKFTPTGEECYYFYPCKDLRDDSYLDDPKTSFYSLWKSINSQDSWDANPWVWVIDFNASIPSI